MQPDSAYQATSRSKPVFAYAVLKLVEQDRLALDAPVLEYLPQGYGHSFDPLKPGLGGGVFPGGPVAKSMFTCAESPSRRLFPAHSIRQFTR